MAVQGQRVCISLNAAADLSSHQFSAVTLTNTGGVNAVSSAATALQAVGILENKPKSAGQPATVCVSGMAKATVGGAVTAGAWLHVDDDGHLVATTTAADAVIGRALESGASGQVVSVLIDCITRQHFGA